MKTAISLPDSIFERASHRANDLGMSRSEFFARAAEHYLDHLDAQSLTAQINTALEHADLPDESTLDAVEAGRRTLADADTW
jgi:metal-responsive CopG/Arc/MetJ family transcriptional regulator